MDSKLGIEALGQDLGQHQLVDEEGRPTVVGHARRPSPPRTASRRTACRRGVAKVTLEIPWIPGRVLDRPVWRMGVRAVGVTGQGGLLWARLAFCCCNDIVGVVGGRRSGQSDVVDPSKGVSTGARSSGVEFFFFEGERGSWICSRCSRRRPGERRHRPRKRRREGRARRAEGRRWCSGGGPSNWTTAAMAISPRGHPGGGGDGPRGPGLGAGDASRDAGYIAMDLSPTRAVHHARRGEGRGSWPRSAARAPEWGRLAWAPATARRTSPPAPEKSHGARDSPIRRG